MGAYFRETTISIASAQTDSGSRQLDPFTKSIGIQAPATLTGTITIQVSTDDSTFVPLQSAGADVTIAVSQGVVLTDLPFEYLRVQSSGAEAAQRDFVVTEKGN